MTKICAWCRADLGRVPGNRRLDFPVTHGICPACKDQLLAERQARQPALAN